MGMNELKNPLQAMLEGQFASMQENINKVLEELENTVIEGSAGGGAVQVKITGSGNVLDVAITPAAVSDQDIELLQDLVCAAVRDAIAKATALKKEKLLGATPFGALGMDLPDVF